MIGEDLRRWGFWTLDYLRGGQVRKHYKNIKDIIERGYYENPVTEEYLNNLLNHVVNNTDYYYDYRNYNGLEDFPVVDKNIIRENQNKIISKKHIGEKLHSMSTSGSTGTPFKVFQDINKRKRVLAEIIYFGELCGYNLGDRNAYLRVWTEENKKSKLDAWKQNLAMIDISKLDEENLGKLRNNLKKDRRLKCILGYATSLDIISKHFLESGDRPEMFSINTVISGAEVLSETTRSNLKKVFGCNVVSRYSNQENGILAQEPIDENYFIINNASYYIEFLKLDSDEEAEFGELSRVVITDLFNYAMPMIRYDTGDLAIVEEHDKYGKVITSIEGRKRDFIYSTSGELLSPSVVTVNMWKYKKIKQFQLIQEDKCSYTLKINGAKDIYKDEEIIRLFKSFLGRDADINIEHVDEIPLLKSGKFQTTICKYNPDSN